MDSMQAASLGHASKLVLVSSYPLFALKLRVI
jgi:hypothetical protein